MTAEELRRGPVAAAIRRHRLIAVLRRVEPRARLVALVEELAEAGVRIFEVTFDAADASADLVAVRERLERREAGAATPEDDAYLVGAGTVTGRDQLAAARSAGARFVVAPILDPGLVAAALASGLPCIPGAFSPTEIATAWAAGATFVKLFPASAVGPSFVRELRGPLPEVELIPTGGLDAELGRAFLEAGAVAVGLGGALTRADAATRRAIVATIVSPAAPAAAR